MPEDLKIFASLTFFLLLSLTVSCDKTPTNYSELPNGEFYSLHFISPDVGWVSGSEGRIWNTINGGNSWKEQEIGFQEDIYEVYFIDSNNGWAASDRSVFRSEDGGITWNKQLEDSELSRFVGMWFINNGTGWIYGPNNGKIYHTSNYGDEWNIQILETQGRILDLSFISSELGWAVGSTNSPIFKTVDGGNNWVELPGPVFSWTVSFIDSKTGFTGDNTNTSSTIMNAKIHKTIDGGISWITQEIPETKLLKEIKFISKNVGWALYSGESIGQSLIYTLNGGSEWEVYTLRQLEGEIIDISIVSEDISWALSKDGRVYRLRLFP